MGYLQLGMDPEKRRDAYTFARPFPHIVLDGLLPDALLDRVLAGFPKPDDPAWSRFDNALEKKRSCVSTGGSTC